MIANEIATLKGPVLSEPGGLQRLESLYACLNATKAWFDVFFSIPIAEYVGFPLTIWSQFTHSLLAIYQLMSLEDPGWDKRLVRNTVDLLQMVEQLGFNAGQVAAMSGLDTSGMEDHFFTGIAKKLKLLAEGWAARLGLDSTGAAADRNKQAIDESAVEFPSFELFDEGWWNEPLLL